MHDFRNNNCSKPLEGYERKILVYERREMRRKRLFDC
jgi:hypothetical protein